MLIEGTSAVDIGDVPWDDTAHEANRAAIRHTCETVLTAGAVPVVLGGDDSIPIPVLQAYGDQGPITIVQIDAHIDWRDEVQWRAVGAVVDDASGIGDGTRRRDDSGRPARRRLGSPGRSGCSRGARRELLLGARCSPTGHRSDPRHRASGGNVFITVDVDGLDPSIVPGVIGPEPGGLTYFQAIEIIDGVADRARIVGFDVVEFVPERDVNGIGALTTFRLAAHAIGRISRQRASAAATA